MQIEDAAEHSGRAVGTVKVEIALGKGAGLVFKALSATKFGASLASKARVLGGEIKQSVGKIPIPTNGSVKVVVDTMGNKMVFPDIELTKLEDLIKPLESRAQQMLSGGKAINLPSWNKLTVDAEHILSGHKTGGTRLTSSVKSGKGKDVFPEWMTDKQILSAVKEAYGNSKKIKTQVVDGETIIKLIGDSEGTKIEMYVNLTQKKLTTAYPLFGIGK